MITDGSHSPRSISQELERLDKQIEAIKRGERDPLGAGTYSEVIANHSALKDLIEAREHLAKEQKELDAQYSDYSWRQFVTHLSLAVQHFDRWAERN